MRTRGTKLNFKPAWRDSLTNSSIASIRPCARRYKIYVTMNRSKRASAASRFRETFFSGMIFSILLPAARCSSRSLLNFGTHGHKRAWYVNELENCRSFSRFMVANAAMTCQTHW